MVSSMSSRLNTNPCHLAKMIDPPIPRTARKVTAEERTCIVSIRQAGSSVAGEVLAGLRRRFMPGTIADVVARLPTEAQARFAAEFELRPVRRVEKVRMTRPTKKP